MINRIFQSETKSDEKKKSKIEIKKYDSNKTFEPIIGIPTARIACMPFFNN